MLACPECLSGIEFKEDKVVCLNEDCSKKEYPVVNGVPVMFHSQSEALKEHGEEYFIKRDSTEKKVKTKFSLHKRLLLEL